MEAEMEDMYHGEEDGQFHQIAWCVCEKKRSKKCALGCAYHTAWLYGEIKQVLIAGVHLFNLKFLHR